MPIEPFNLLSLQEAMDTLGVSRSTLDRWRKHKGLPYRKIGKEILIERSELEQWVHQHSSIIHQQQEEPLSGREGMGGPGAIRIGYQSRSAQVWTSLLMKEFGWFEEELAGMLGKQAPVVQWIDASSGPELVQLMIGGDLHIASLGDYPIALSFSLSRILPSFKPVLLAFDGKTTGGEGVSLVVRNDIQINRLSQLSEISLTAVAQSASGCRLARLMRTIGIKQESHVHHQELDESLSGIMKRHIGGSMLTEPYISLIRHNGMGRVLFQEGMQDDFVTGVIADERWIESHPDAAIAYLKAHLRVHHFMRNDPVRASEIIARLRGLSSEVACEVIRRIRWDAALYERDVACIEGFQAELDRESSLLYRQTGSTVHRSEFLLQAMEMLKLPTPGTELLQGEWTRYHLY